MAYRLTGKVKADGSFAVTGSKSGGRGSLYGSTPGKQTFILREGKEPNPNFSGGAATQSTAPVSAPASTSDGLGYYLVGLYVNLQINGSPCQINVYGCGESTAADIEWFMQLMRKFISEAIGKIPVEKNGDGKCIKTAKIISLKQAVKQGPSKTPIKVPKPFTNCPCSNTADFQRSLASEYNPNCSSYEEFLEAKRMLQQLGY